MAKKSSGFLGWWNGLSRLVQIILLIIPVVNWIMEIGVRWSTVLSKGGVLRTIIAIIVTFAGLVFGWIDVIWTLLFKKLIFQ